MLGVVALTRAAAQKITDGGRIVFVESGPDGRVTLSTVTEYSANKAALVGYVKGASRDLEPRNITVNVAQPGIMPTDVAAAGEVRPPGLSDTMSIAHIATLEEVAASIAFLVGPDAGYITGAVLYISGGYQA